jgi:hypothetical protein
MARTQLIREVGALGIAALAEVLASRTVEAIVTGDYSSAAIAFADYWGERTWVTLRTVLQAAGFGRFAP